MKTIEKRIISVLAIIGLIVALFVVNKAIHQSGKNNHSESPIDTLKIDTLHSEILPQDTL